MFGITSGTILDVAIGLAVMYLMFSLVGTTVNEMVATMTKLRARYLSSAIQGIIDHPPLRSDFYNSGIVAGVDSALQSIVGGPLLNSNWLKFVRFVFDRSGPVAVASDGVTNHPSYISSDSFALALLNSLDPSKSLPVFADVRQSVQLMPDCNIRDVMLAQIVAANGDLDKLRTGVATWFDAAMDRVGGVYKRDMKYISVFVGILLAIAFNADSVSVTRALWQDPALRAQMVDVGEKLAEDHLKKQVESGAQPAPEKTPDVQLHDQLVEIQKNIDNANSALKPLPIGWNGVALTVGPTTWIERVIGWLVTGLAVSLGAPFWFDILSKLVNIRGAGDKPAKATDGSDSDS
jgi:hypothetical protein